MSYILNTELQSKEIYLDSKQGRQLNGSKNSEILFDLDEAIIKPKYYNFLVSLVNIEIPNSQYNINDTNNTYNGYTLTKGNYNINTLLTALKALDNRSTFLYDSLTSKVQITNLDGSISGSVLKVLGFENTSYSSYNITSEYIVDLNTIKYFLVQSNINTHNANCDLTDSNNYLARIPNNRFTNQMCFYESVNPTKFIYRDNEINYLYIKIIDQDRNEIDFNNIRWSLTLQVDYIHYTPPIINPQTFIGFYQQKVNEYYNKKHIPTPYIDIEKHPKYESAQ